VPLPASYCATGRLFQQQPHADEIFVRAIEIIARHQIFVAVLLRNAVVFAGRLAFSATGA